jgi:hypothetical protein
VEIRFIRTARKHRIGKAHALHVMFTFEPELVPATEELDRRLVWDGTIEGGPDGAAA